MNKTLQEKLCILEGLIGTQKQSVIAGHPSTDYMHGMANGMILAHSIFADSKPMYVKHPYRRKRTRTKIRHKKLLGGLR